MNDVFISYSTKDSEIAFRIYYDLSRSGIKVYLYERDGENGIDFRKEIYSRIDDSDYICLIDSPDSRKSKWVREECRYSIGLVGESKSIKKIIPCIVEKQSDWFFCHEHFPNQSAIRGIDFSGFDYLDYKEKYKHSILQLCKTLNINFTPWAELPQESDFEKELALFSISDKIKAFLTSDYRNFILSTDSKSITQLNRIKNLISDCERLNIRIITSYLALGAIYAEENKDLYALDIFEKICKEFSQDARGWAALSGVQFYLKDYKHSLSSINNSLKIIEQFSDNEYLQRHKGEVIYNKIQILIQLNDYVQASILLYHNYNLSLAPEYLCAKIILSICLDNSDFDNYYKTLVNNYYNFDFNSKLLNIIIGDLEFQLGRYYVKKMDYVSGIKHYKTACEIQVKNIQYAAGFFLLQKVIGKIEYFHLDQILSKLLPTTDAEFYYYGLLNYLKGDFETANNYYHKSSLNWERYYDLIEY